jgi:hypothetical protein
LLLYPAPDIETAQFRHFLHLARLLQRAAYRRMTAAQTKGKCHMSVFSNYSQQILAAVGALAISALLFANTLATQAAEIHSVAGILA